MIYECLYTVKDNKFVIAKPEGFQWGPGELNANMFKIVKEDLTAEQLQVKYDSLVSQEAKDAMAKLEADRKAREEKYK